MRRPVRTRGSSCGLPAQPASRCSPPPPAGAIPVCAAPNTPPHRRAPALFPPPNNNPPCPQLAASFGWAWLVKTYVVPYLIVNAWLVTITLLQHTHPGERRCAARPCSLSSHPAVFPEERSNPACALQVPLAAAPRTAAQSGARARTPTTPHLHPHLTTPHPHLTTPHPPTPRRPRRAAALQRRRVGLAAGCAGHGGPRLRLAAQHPAPPHRGHARRTPPLLHHAALPRAGGGGRVGGGSGWWRWRGVRGWGGGVGGEGEGGGGRGGRQLEQWQAPFAERVAG
jgi:hypothetical protein